MSNEATCMYHHALLVVKFWYSIQPHAFVQINLVLNVIFSCRVKDIKGLLSHDKQRHNVKLNVQSLNLIQLLDFLNGRKRKCSKADHTLLLREEQGFL